MKRPSNDKPRLVKILSMHLPPPPMPASPELGPGAAPVAPGGGGLDPMHEAIVQAAIDRAMAGGGGGQ